MKLYWKTEKIYFNQVLYIIFPFWLHRVRITFYQVSSSIWILIQESNPTSIQIMVPICLPVSQSKSSYQRGFFLIIWKVNIPILNLHFNNIQLRKEQAI